MCLLEIQTSYALVTQAGPARGPSCQLFRHNRSNQESISFLVITQSVIEERLSSCQGRHEGLFKWSKGRRGMDVVNDV